jgi:hypothetical protein
MPLMMETTVAAARSMIGERLGDISLHEFRQVVGTLPTERRWALAAYAEIAEIAEIAMR